MAARRAKSLSPSPSPSPSPSCVPAHLSVGRGRSAATAISIAFHKKQIPLSLPLLSLSPSRSLWPRPPAPLSRYRDGNVRQRRHLYELAAVMYFQNLTDPTRAKERDIKTRLINSFILFNPFPVHHPTYASASGFFRLVAGTPVTYCPSRFWAKKKPGADATHRV